MGNWIRSRYFEEYLPRYTSAIKVRRVLDAGCGTGWYTVALARLFPDAHVFGVDIKEFKDWPERRGERVTFFTGDLRVLKTANPYDVISSVDVLEHIVGNIEVLKVIHSALSDQGVFYLAVPCETDELHIFPKSWFGRFHDWEKDEHIGEQRTLKDLTLLMEELGFEILFSRNTFTFWGVLAWEVETLLHWRGKRGRQLNVVLMPFYKTLGWLDRRIPIGGGNNLVIARRKRKTAA